MIDLALINGKIWTVDKGNPLAEAVAVAGNKITAVGSNEEIKKLISPETKLIDLKGRLTLPGFIDNHVHFVSGGLRKLGLNLSSAKDEKHFVKLIRRKAESIAEGAWITGGGWNHEKWPTMKLPTKDLIDAYTSDIPVLVSRCDGHIALANSCALKLAGIEKDTADPQGGAIDRDPETREPTGILKDAAIGLVCKHIPQQTEKELMEGARAALAEARKLGVTSVQDMSAADDLRAYQTLMRAGELTVRVYCRSGISQFEHLANIGVTAGFGNEMIAIGSLKGFADGSLGARTALMFEPYHDRPDTSTAADHQCRSLDRHCTGDRCGLAMESLADGSLAKWAVEADVKGLQLSIHAIGDKANSLVLDIYEQVLESNGERDRRFRIEHAQHIHPSDFERFAKLEVIASMQPYHAIDDGCWAEKTIGRKRCEMTYAFRTFLDNGVTVTFGSDWPVVTMNPLLGIAAAVNRQTTDGKNPHGWFPEQKISVEEAIEAYTLANAYAAFEEKTKGSITTGKLADLVILSDDILTMPATQIATAHVDMTIFDGKIVYERTYNAFSI